MATRSVPTGDERLEGCLNLANKLIRLCKLPQLRICQIEDIDSHFISTLFERICRTPVPDILSGSGSIAEAHNVQAVIDTLSLDILGISLSHIQGEDIVSGNVNAICDLLEIFESVLLNYIPEILKRKKMQVEIQHKAQPEQDTEQIVPDSSKTSSDLQREFKRRTSRKVRKRANPNVASKSSPVVIEKLQPEFAQAGLRHTKIIEKNLNGPQPSTSQAVSSTSIRPPVLKTVVQRDKSLQKTSQEEIPIKFLSPLNKQDKAKNVKQVVSEETIPKRISREAFTKDPIYLPIRATVKRKPFPKQVNMTEKRVRMDSVKQKDLAHLYANHFETLFKIFLESHSLQNEAACQMKKSYMHTLKKPNRASPVVCRKSFLLPADLRKTHRPSRKSVSPLQELFETFPGIQLPESTLRLIQEKYERHLSTMHKQIKRTLSKTSRTQLQAEEASKRQAILSNILQKEMHHAQHLKSLREQGEDERRIKAGLRDTRLRSARMKRYYETFFEEMRKKMQCNDIKEQLLVENAFKERLKIEKEQVLLQQKQVKEAEENDAKQHKIYLDALENFYQSQFLLLTESLAIEKRDLLEREKAQKKVLREMRKEFQENLESEVHKMQSEILAEQDIHFRELDAQCYIEMIRDRYGV